LSSKAGVKTAFSSSLYGSQSPESVVQAAISATAAGDDDSQAFYSPLETLTTTSSGSLGRYASLADADGIAIHHMPCVFECLPCIES
jgi:hypothetical protein